MTVENAWRKKSEFTALIPRQEFGGVMLGETYLFKILKILKFSTPYNAMRAMN